jgi:hypothetical protein
VVGHRPALWLAGARSCLSVTGPRKAESVMIVQLVIKRCSPEILCAGEALRVRRWRGVMHVDACKLAVQILDELSATRHTADAEFPDDEK